MFLFIHCHVTNNNDNNWFSFIKLFHTLCHNKNICINKDLLNAILIQTIYKHYLLQTLPHFNKSLNIFHYGFNYNCNPIHFSDINFWKVCTISYNNIFYLYHKSTNAILLNKSNTNNNNIQIYFIGILDTSSNSIIYKHNCNLMIQKWFTQCGFV